ncbi:unnamed protein product [Citrullus colocynthis]|uniref:Uncharacterized protein n=1 Tax=Citrullus colocynthis TaxID=252529 RepID=A0ABP0Y3Q3_9ROSI
MPGSATQCRPLSPSLGHTFRVSSIVIVSSRLLPPSRDLNKPKMENQQEGDLGRFCVLLLADEAMAANLHPPNPSSSSSSRVSSPPATISTPPPLFFVRPSPDQSRVVPALASSLHRLSRDVWPVRAARRRRFPLLTLSPATATLFKRSFESLFTLKFFVFFRSSGLGKFYWKMRRFPRFPCLIELTLDLRV